MVLRHIDALECVYQWAFRFRTCRKTEINDLFSFFIFQVFILYYFILYVSKQIQNHYRSTSYVFICYQFSRSRIIVFWLGMRKPYLIHAIVLKCHCNGKIVDVVLIATEQHFRTRVNGAFSFSISCLVSEIFRFLKPAN